MIKMKKSDGAKAQTRLKYIISTVVMVLTGIIMVVHLLILLVPLLWGAIASLKDTYDFAVNPFSFPDIVCWDNYVRAFKGFEVEYWNSKEEILVSYTFFNMLVNSLIYTFVAPAWFTFVTFTTAYVLARYRFWLGRAMYNFGILMMVLPFGASLGTTLYLRKILGLYDNMFLHILTGPTGFSMNMILIYGTVKALTDDYGHAAQIDGAGHYTIMFKIYFPMVFPLIFGLYLLSFVGTWNDYSTFLVYLPSTPNLAYGAYAFNEYALVKRYSTPEVMAAFMIIVIPSLVFWVTTHNKSMSAMKIGGLKG